MCVICGACECVCSWEKEGGRGGGRKKKRGGKKEEEEEEEVVVVVEEVVFTRDNRGGSAQHATRATPTRSSHGPMRA